jgi:hypothetical protein
MQILPREIKKRNVKERAPESPCNREKTTTKSTQQQIIQKPASHRPLKKDQEVKRGEREP